MGIFGADLSQHGIAARCRQEMPPWRNRSDRLDFIRDPICICNDDFDSLFFAEIPKRLLQCSPKSVDFFIQI